ncbi:hypothetical protein QIS74_12038 [Colletotrichum tabaci]|uniref:Uncharacterized protein n=1 Tax=Colletotrichum tabaci TaxID=1209068 RepID=A0AAV9SVY5_9PEZI
MARGEASGNLLLGHVIPSLKALDQVINSDGPLPFPKDMRIEQSTMYDIQWSTSKESGIEASAKADVPVAAAAGLSVRGDVALEFQRGVGDSWQFDQVQTQTIRPTKNYIRQCLKTPLVAAHIDSVKFLDKWKLLMVSGIMIAKGARTERTESKGRVAHLKPGMNMAEVVSAEIGAGVSRTTQSSLSAQHANDFIWAVRLTELSKSPFRSEVSERVLTKGATLGLDDDLPDIGSIADAAGLLDYHHIEHETADEGQKIYFIFPTEEEETET